MSKGRKKIHVRESFMESIPYPPIEYEKPEKEASMISENTEQTLGENIEKNKKNLARSGTPEQQAFLANSKDLGKQPKGKKESFYQKEADFLKRRPLLPQLESVKYNQPKMQNWILLLKNMLRADPGKERRTERQE